MSSVLNDIEALDELIRKLEKNNSKMQSGQFIAAWRENSSIIASLKVNRADIIKEKLDDEE